MARALLVYQAQIQFERVKGSDVAVTTIPKVWSCLFEIMLKRWKGV